MLTLLAICTLTAAPSVTVNLPMEAHVQGTEIELGEVATVTGTDETAVALIESIELGYAPSPGYSRLLRADRILSTLRTKAPGVRVRMMGQKATRVWPEVSEVPLADVQKVALDELRRTFAAMDARFEFASPLPKIMVPAGGTAPVLRAKVDSKQLTSGLISVPVEVLIDGAVYRTIWTSWNADVYQTLPVLAQDVPAGTVFSAKHFENRRVRLGAGRTQLPLAPSRLEGAVASRALKAGTIVVATDVYRPAVVDKNDTIFLCVKKGNIEARVPAMALGAGAVGDRIRVRILDSGQELTAVIRSRDLAMIDLSR